MSDPHPMRRADREMRDPAALSDVLRRAEVLSLAMTDGGEPYVVPVNFGYEPGPDGGPEGGVILVHCAEAGRKLDAIARSPRVCFTAYVDAEVAPGKACGWTAYFRSVVGWGTASLVTDRDERKAALEMLVAHYSGTRDALPASAANGVAVIRIDVDRVTGKARLRKR